MPSRAKKLDRTVSRLPSIPKELVAQFLTGPMTGEAINAAGSVGRGDGCDQYRARRIPRGMELYDQAEQPLRWSG
jgi:hypothetical protein